MFVRTIFLFLFCIGAVSMGYAQKQVDPSSMTIAMTDTVVPVFFRHSEDFHLEAWVAFIRQHYATLGERNGEIPAPSTGDMGLLEKSPSAARREN
jgi:hypothetical protein